MEKRSRWVELFGGPSDGEMIEMPKAYEPHDPGCALIVGLGRLELGDG